MIDAMISHSNEIRYARRLGLGLGLMLGLDFSNRMAQEVNRTLLIRFLHHDLRHGVHYGISHDVGFTGVHHGH